MKQIKKHKIINLKKDIDISSLNELSIDLILETLPINLTKEEIFEIMSIKYINFPDKYILSKDDLDLVYEIINFNIIYGFKKCLELLENISKSSVIINSKIIFKTDLFNEQYLKYEENNEKLKTKIHIVEGNTSCSKCKSLEVFAQGNQTRSGDEGLTYSYICLNCGNKWKQNT